MVIGHNFFWNSNSSYTESFARSSGVIQNRNAAYARCLFQKSWLARPDCGQSRRSGECHPREGNREELPERNQYVRDNGGREFLYLSLIHIYLQKFEKSARNMQSLSRYSRSNSINREWIDQYLNEAHSYGLTSVRDVYKRQPSGWSAAPSGRPLPDCSRI